MNLISVSVSKIILNLSHNFLEDDCTHYKWKKTKELKD